MLKNIIKLLSSMITVAKHLFKRPVTLEYPEKRQIIPEKFRGKPVLDGCVACRTCIKVCPAGAIGIKDDSFCFDLKKCIFCGNCSFYCPQNAIKMSNEYELATNDINDLKLVYKIGGRAENNGR